MTSEVTTSMSLHSVSWPRWPRFAAVQSVARFETCFVSSSQRNGLSAIVSTARGIARSIALLRGHFDQPLRVERLADAANMSTPARTHLDQLRHQGLESFPVRFRRLWLV
jgi:transcriptional regulator GlxA family with amidase domain